MQRHFTFQVPSEQLGLPPHNHTDTSQAAAAQVAPRAGTTRHHILVLIRDSGGDGRTIDEIDAITDLGSGTVCPRVNELSKGGLIRDSGRRRNTRKGSPAKVWVATERNR